MFEKYTDKAKDNLAKDAAGMYARVKETLNDTYENGAPIKYGVDAVAILTAGLFVTEAIRNQEVRVVGEVDPRG